MAIMVSCDVDKYRMGYHAFSGYKEAMKYVHFLKKYFDDIRDGYEFTWGGNGTKTDLMSAVFLWLSWDVYADKYEVVVDFDARLPDNILQRVKEGLFKNVKANYQEITDEVRRGIIRMAFGEEEE